MRIIIVLIALLTSTVQAQQQAWSLESTPYVSPQTPSQQSSRELKELLDRPITLSISNVSVRTAVDAVAKAAKIRIGYQREILDAVPKRITLNVRAMPLGRLLDSIVSGTTVRVIHLPGAQLAIGERERPGREGRDTVTPPSASVGTISNNGYWPAAEVGDWERHYDYQCRFSNAGGTDYQRHRSSGDPYPGDDGAMNVGDAR
jgi:hypothetical protein